MGRTGGEEGYSLLGDPEELGHKSYKKSGVSFWTGGTLEDTKSV